MNDPKHPLDVDPEKPFDAGTSDSTAETVVFDGKVVSVAVTPAPTHEAKPVPQAPVVTQPAQEPTRPTSLQAKGDGRLVGNTLEEQYRLAKAYHASGLMPKGLNTPEKVLVALQLCHELNLPPITSVGKIMVVNGTPSLFGEMPLALVMRSRMLEEFKEEFIRDAKGALLGARCTLRRNGRDTIMREFTLADADRAGLTKKDIWRAYPQRMLQFRARSWALKDEFPDVLGGIHIMEWDGDIGEARSNLADELNEAYHQEGESNGEAAAVQVPAGNEVPAVSGAAG